MSNSRVAEVDNVSDRIIGAYEKTSLSSDNHLAEVMTNLQTQSALLTTAIKRMKAESDLELKDEDRDQAVRALYYLLKAYLNHPNTTIKNAAVQLDDLFEHYGISVTVENYATESAHINSMLEDLAAEKYQPLIAVLPACAGLITALETAQSAFEEARIAFETEKAEEGTQSSASEIKKVVGSIINNKLVVYLRAMVQVDGETYGPFGNTVSEIINDNNVVVKKRKKNTEQVETKEE